MALACALVLVLSAQSHAQSTGTLWGRVSDRDSGVIRDVLITLRNSNIGFERTTQTDHDGLYQIAGLAPGVYQIEVRADGFRVQVVDEIAVDVGQTLVQDFHLELGSLEQEVVVNVLPPLIDPATAPVGRVVDQTAIRNLPLNGRNFLELAQLEPSIKVLSVTNPGTGANNYARVTVAGAFFSQTRISIDGSTINDRFIGGATQNFSQESVHEFQIASWCPQFKSRL